MNAKNKVCLIIMDGWGIAPAWGGNAISLANTPNFNLFLRSMPHSEIFAAAEAVGLPRKEMGNSEVGHLNIGAGHVIHQDLLLINNEISERTFFTNNILLGAFRSATQKNSKVHLIGLLSPGGVHSHISHLYALLEMAKMQNFTNIYLHLFTDGRDTAPMEALGLILKLKEKIKQLGVGKIASLSGRYYAMDRNKTWARTEKVYNLLTSGIAPKGAEPEKIIADSYRAGITDEFIVPTIVDSPGDFCPIDDSDSIILFNFRRDRIDQLTKALALPKFKDFERRKIVENLYVSTFVSYESKELPVLSVFHAKKIASPLAAIISANNLRQFHIAETEKYAHVTYFFNGGEEIPFVGEDRQLIPSPNVATYNLCPEMSAYKITEVVIEKIRKELYNFIVINFANPDMVGHTGDLNATILACEAVDLCIGRIVEEAKKKNMVTIITADHGNAEEMVNPETGEPWTEHTTNPVPFIIIPSSNLNISLSLESGNLANVSPTILDIMGLKPPENFVGASLSKTSDIKQNKEGNADSQAVA